MVNDGTDTGNFTYDSSMRNLLEPIVTKFRQDSRGKGRHVGLANRTSGHCLEAIGVDSFVLMARKNLSDVPMN